MNILDFKELGDWRLLNECVPFEDSFGNLCIAVKSKYESFGGEKDARLLEAKKYGIDRLIRFYGKVYFPDGVSLSQVASDGVEITISQASVITITPTKLYDAASTPDNFISTRACARMKVLVKIPKSTFDDYTVNDTACDINKPSEGYLSAFISVENYERDIDYITTSMEDFLPKMAKANKYMTNINIVKEIKRLKQVKSVIRRYLNLNSVTATAIKEEECDADVESLMEVGFDYNYSPVFVLIDGNKHTIGYDCFLETSPLNHSTTVNYLIQLGNMSHALTKQLSLDFDIFEFLTQYTYPTPVIETKENTLDGLDKYDANGNLFSFANLAKLITLELDKKSCKPDENVSSENRIIINKATRAEAARAAAQTKQFIGDWRLSTEGAEELKETLGSMWEAVSDRHEAEKALKKVMNDVLEKVNWGCVLEESLQCMLEESITKFGTSVFDDPDLGQFFSADGAVELEGLCQPDDGCENELQLRVGIPAFQGITIPTNFPTTDYLAKTIDLALGQLYNVLINSFVSLIMSLLDNVCKMISSLSEGAAIGNMFTDSFTSWLSETIGIDVSLLKDGQAWQDAALSAGGAGFMGVIGNFVSKTAGSMDSSGNWVWGGSVTAVYSGTGVSLNLPNPNTGMVEEMFISPELISNVISGFRKGTEDLEVVLTSGELYSMYKGSAPADVVELAFDCLNRGNPEIFQSQEDVTDVFSALGEMVNGSHLENPSMSTPVVTSMCDLGDGSNQDILRKNFLRKKDSLLSDLEIEELMSIEKSRFIEKIKKMHKLLKSFQDGSIFPDFPSLFGSEDSLIPEAPPIIADAMKTAIEGLYGSTISNLNGAVSIYPALWKNLTYYTDETSETYEYTGENDPSQISDNIKVLFQLAEANDGAEKIQYNIGYTQPEYAESEIVEITTIEEKFGPYYYGGDFDSGYDTREKKGEDDEEMERFLDEYNERMPQGYLWRDGYGEKGDKYGKYYRGAGKVARAVEERDHRSGREEDTIDDIDSDDYENYTKPDNVDIEFFITNDNDSKQFWVTHIETTHTGETNVVRSDDYTDNIVTVESKTDGSIKGILYTSADYTIGNNEAALGRTISTGMLKEHKVGTIDIIDLDDLQDIQFEQLEILTDGFEDSEVYKSIVEGMANSISNGRSSGSDLDALAYPTKDILGYSQIIEESSELLSMLFPLSLSDDYCDKLSPLRRMGTISGLRLFIRTAIVESAMIAIQVFDVYGTDFIDDDVFVEIIKKKIKYNTSRYQNSFDALDGDLFSDMKDTALKYNEIQILIGSDIEKIDSGSQALEEMIKTEASLIKENISSALELNWNYSSWDDFIVEKVFGEVENINDAMDIDSIVPIKEHDKPSFIFWGRANVQDNKVTYIYELARITKIEGTEQGGYTQGGMSQYSSNVSDDTVMTSTVILAECEQDGDYKDDVLPSLKAKLLASEEYKTLFSKTFPIKEIASSLALYQESALSDDSVFHGPTTEEPYPELNGKNLFDMLSETKLSTLQTFLTCLNGAGETVYIDPFLEKLKT